MRKKIGILLTVVSGAAGLTAIGVLTNCVSDSREDQAVTVVGDCDLSKLDSTPASPEATVLAYVKASEALATQAQDVDTQMMGICNQMDTDLGLATGTDVVSACTPISKRVVAAFSAAPPPPPGPAPPPWFNLGYDTSCKTDPNARAACVATCAGPCDNSKCDPAKLTGTCPGNCTGVCTNNGGTLTCKGACEGVCEPDKNGCSGECIGICGAPLYQGTCAKGCAGPPGIGFFNGFCGGTCTGLCNGAPINGGLPMPGDGGAPSDAGDDSGDAAMDASGPPPGDGGGWPPTNDNGNCVGTCLGVCSSQASGACMVACPGGPPTDAGPYFFGGVCRGGPCIGTCISGATGANAGGSGCVTTDPEAGPPSCDGTCIENTGDAGESCAGLCAGGCDQPLANSKCSGALNCNQSPQCDNACQVEGVLSLTCQPPDAVEVESITDHALYLEFKKLGPQLAVQLQRLYAYKAAEGFIAQQTISDFAAIGASGDLVRACVARGNTGFTNADK
ncbi:MAG: hypothetical protein ACREJX_00695, partial [Polyangiaceae bacterium]